MRTNLLILLAFALGTSLAIPARGASIVYDNGGGPTSSQFFPSTSTFPLADDFVLASGLNSFNQITWWAGYFGPTPDPDQLSVRIYLDDGGLPDQTSPLVLNEALTSLTRTDTGETIAGLGRPVFRFDAQISTLTLNAGQTYWLSLINTGGPNHLWATTDSVSGNPHAFFFRDSDPDEWRSSTSGRDLAFNLSVPEPASLGLLALGGLLLIARFHRRHRNW